MSKLKKYGFIWVTLAFFVLSIGGHWLFGWFAYVNQAQAHHQPVRTAEYLVEITRDTFENWQSEFLQLIWQVAGLAFLLCVGSRQSKDSDERLEAKVDFLLSQTDEGRRTLAALDQQFPRQ
jgi:hypothetical protein